MAGINLVKGQKIDLKKSSGATLQNICLGLNWGMIESKTFFGSSSKEAVDLDGSCAVFDNQKKLIDVVYFGNLQSINGAIKHSGDDLTGDEDGDDGLDNEIIFVDINSLPSNADQIIFFINSYKGQDFASIPFSTIRLYQGNFTRVDEVIAVFDIANDKKFKGCVSMVMGKIYKRNGEWKFSAIGEPTKDKKLGETIETATRLFL
jgi:tellurium resistance protein TerZ